RALPGLFAAASPLAPRRATGSAPCGPVLRGLASARRRHDLGAVLPPVRDVPELPEVETTRRGLAPHLVGRRVGALDVRQPRLRWPVAPELSALLPGQRIDGIERRAKYLLVHTAPGSALLHLGMSGALRVLPAEAPVGAHDHVDWRLDSGRVLRYTDPR